MTKAIKYEQLIRAFIYVVFLVVCVFNICRTSANEPMSYYAMVFNNKDLGIYGNVLLGIPAVLAVIIIILSIVQFFMRNLLPGIKYSITIFSILFAAFGLIFCLISPNNLFPYGTIIIIFTVAVMVLSIVVHYGLRSQII